jgi:hypothetical protein
LKKKQWILGVVVLVTIAAILIWGRDRIHFDFALFRAQLAGANWIKISIGLGCIYFAYILRAVRWAMLLRHNKKVNPLSLVGTQVIGFTAVALIGRVADPVRPFLVARKTNLTLSSQIAVYIVERLFDAGSMALVFSIAMIWVPSDEILKALSHSTTIARLAAHDRFAAILFARFGGLALTLLGALFLVAVRISGEAVAAFFEKSLAPVSKGLGVSLGNKIRTFHSGLDTMRSFSDFALTASLSVGMWLLIAFAYFETIRAFGGSPELASISAPRCVLLMIASGGASIVQLPVIGWFSQIGLVALALSLITGSGSEAATACAALLLIVSFLAVVPVGLIWAQVDHISLRQITNESEKAEEVLEANGEAPAAEASRPAS